MSVHCTHDRTSVWRTWASALSPRAALGVMRVVAYAFVVSLLCAGLGARAVYASFEEGALQAGRELTGLSDVLGSTKTLGINGAIMNVSTAVTDESPSEVLDRFEAMCRAHPETLVRALENIPATLQAAAEKAVPSARLRLGIMRRDAGDDGALTCFTDDRPASMDGAIAHLRAFVKSRDLAELGHFRYVYVNRTGPGSTHVTTVWNNGRFNLGEMFPAAGDAPGSDSTMVPRPPNAKRTFSAAAAGVPFAVRIYDSGKSEGQIRSFYGEQMAARGWRVVSDRPTEHGAAYMKNAATILYLSMVPRGDRTVVTTTETAREDTPVDVAAALHFEN